MSVIVKGMRMPSSCLECNFLATDNEGVDYCSAVMVDICGEYPKLEDCPLVELPTPHGRLLDADKLKNHYSWWENGTREMTLDEAKTDFDVIVDVQPTVIEAED